MAFQSLSLQQPTPQQLIHPLNLPPQCLLYNAVVVNPDTTLLLLESVAGFLVHGK